MIHSHENGRSPCPGINTFANHGFIPRDGFNVSFAEIRAGIVEAANFHPSLIDSIIAAGVGGSTTEYDDTIHLDDLAIHGFPGEVDGSMSRNDIFFGDNHSFNATIWDMSFAHFHNPVVSVQDAAQVCVDRFAADDAANPEFDPKSPEGTPPMTVCFGSAGLYMLLMRDADGNPVRDWINTFFRHERLPEGWAKWPTPVTADDLNASLEAVMAAASGLTPSVRRHLL
ncbi:Uu.00g022190.m01.CDS01 [Anthostomella pinea]|uniref:Uu.00g022190.m01.CDS01 n=1 Tax=Anthostomella pinea TaxID=933095 RepID=A0AAI8W0Q8_9PEZI|nr:Uu.00g022190.m01.CDS01 [Anthostomella pinea]